MERYSDEDLAKFGERIKEEYALAKKELEALRGQVRELSETMAEGFGADMGEDSSSVSQLELLNEQVLRKRDHVQDLQNAMLRVKNKVYGSAGPDGAGHRPPRRRAPGRPQEDHFQDQKTATPAPQAAAQKAEETRP